MIKYLWLALAISVQSAYALKLPRSIHRVSDLDTARVEAAEKNKPLIFVYSYEKLKLS